MKGTKVIEVPLRGGERSIRVTFGPSRSRIRVRGVHNVDLDELKGTFTVSRLGPMVTFVFSEPFVLDQSTPDAFLVELEVDGDPLGEPEIVAEAVVGSTDIAPEWAEVYRKRSEEESSHHRFFFELDRRSLPSFRAISEDGAFHNALTHTGVTALGQFVDPQDENAHDLSAFLDRLKADLLARITQRHDTQHQGPLADVNDKDWGLVSTWFRECMMAAYDLEPNQVEAERHRLMEALFHFAAGNLRRSYGIGEDVVGDANSSNIVFFAEAGLILHERNIDPILFDLPVLATLLKMQGLFMSRVGPSNHLDYPAPGPDPARTIDQNWSKVDYPITMTLPDITARMAVNLRRLAPVAIQPST